MPNNKTIYGQGREPKAFEFAIGEIVINVDDKRVFSKDKRNVVFELVGNFEDAPAYRTASISSRFASSSLEGTLTVEFNSDELNGSNSSFTTQLEEGDVILITSASYESYHTIITVDDDNLVHFTPNYINSDLTDIDFVRTTVNLSNQLTASLDNYNLIVSGGTGIQITTGSEENSMIITATGESLAFVDAENIVGDLFSLNDGNQQGQVTFNPDSIPAGGTLSANTVNLSSIGTPTFGSVTTTNFVKTDRLSVDSITSEGAIGTRLVSLVTSSTSNPVITIFKNGGLGVNEVEIGTSTQTNETYLSIYGDVRARRNITTNRTTIDDNYGYISASGLLFASASYDNAGNHNNVVVYDDSTGRFYITGSYGGGGSGDTNQNAWSTASILGTGAQLISNNTIDNLIFEAGPNIFISTGSGGNSIYISASGDGIGGDDGYIGNNLAGGVSHIAGSPLDMDSFNISNIDTLEFNSGSNIQHHQFNVPGNAVYKNQLKVENLDGIILLNYEGSSTRGVSIHNADPSVYDGVTDEGTHDTVLKLINSLDGTGHIKKNSPIGKISFINSIDGASNPLLDAQGGEDVASIKAIADDIFDSDGANPHGPTRLEFYTRPSSSADVNLRMTLTPNSGSLFEGNISSSGILILSASDSTPAVEGGLMYSSSNAFYLGFNDDISLAGFP